MEFYFQQDEELNKRIDKLDYKENALAKWGCYFISLANAITLLEGQVSRDKVVEVAKESIEKGYTDNEFLIQNPTSVIKLFNSKYYYGGFGNAAGEPDNKEDAAFAVTCFEDARGTYKHFILLGVFDSYKGGTQTRRNGWVSSCRVYCRSNV